MTFGPGRDEEDRVRGAVSSGLRVDSCVDKNRAKAAKGLSANPSSNFGDALPSEGEYLGWTTANENFSVPAAQSQQHGGKGGQGSHAKGSTNGGKSGSSSSGGWNACQGAQQWSSRSQWSSR